MLKLSNNLKVQLELIYQSAFLSNQLGLPLLSLGIVLMRNFLSSSKRSIIIENGTEGMM